MTELLSSFDIPGLTIALAGNPNSGKTTVFNELTGAHQHVGNYPGVTVEKKSGFLRRDGETFEVVDLPGTYSLTAYSQEELVARSFLVDERPDVVIDVVDASNLERNLNLAVQLMEMGVPLVIALNMVDTARGRGLVIDEKALSDVLGVPVVPTVGSKGEGIDLLIETAVSVARGVGSWKPADISYGREMDEALVDLHAAVVEEKLSGDRYEPRWLAIKLLEQDEDLTAMVARSSASSRALGIVRKVAHHVEVTLDDTPENLISDYRFAFASSVVKSCLARPREDRRNLSDRIDAVLTHRLGGPVFLFVVLWFVYRFTFTASEWPVLGLDMLFGWAHRAVESAMPAGLLRSLVVSGVIDGVGGVLSFVPLIMFMFFFTAILEDSGYMARMAFIMDRVLRVFGMHGNSMLALIVSGGIAGGCAVPGIMATRTLRDPRERIVTILVAPLLNCGAKLPIYLLLTAAFFPAYRGEIMLLLTLIAWLFVALAAMLIRSTILRGKPSPFVMELPPYRIPTVKGLFIHMWERTWEYVKKAGTILLAISILLWALMTFPGLSREQEQRLVDRGATEGELAQERLATSAAGRIGGALEHVTGPLMGFDWRTDVALVGGFAAKEVIVTTMGTAYSLGEVDASGSTQLAGRLQREPGWSGLTAFALMIFTMLYAPCLATVVVIRRETGSVRWAVFSVVFNTLLATLVTTAIVQLGRLVGLGG